MFLRSSQYQRQARFQTSGNCTVQKRLFGSQKTDFSKFMYNLKIATRWVCVQVVPSGRASIKKNKKKIPNLILVINFSMKKNFLQNLVVPLQQYHQSPVFLHVQVVLTCFSSIYENFLKKIKKTKNNICSTATKNFTSV